MLRKLNLHLDARYFSKCGPLPNAELTCTRFQELPPTSYDQLVVETPFITRAFFRKRRDARSSHVADNGSAC